MKLFDLIKALTQKKVQPKDYTELSLFDDLDEMQRETAAAGQTKTVNGKTYTLQQSSHPGWLRWKAADGKELYTDEKTGEVGDPEKKIEPEKSAPKADHSALVEEFKKRVFEDQKLQSIMFADNSEQSKKDYFVRTLKNKAMNFVNINIDFYKEVMQQLESEDFKADLYKEYKDQVSEKKRKQENDDVIREKKSKRNEILDAFLHGGRDKTSSIEGILWYQKRFGSSKVFYGPMGKKEVRELVNELVRDGYLERYQEKNGEERFRFLKGNWQPKEQVKPASTDTLDMKAPEQPKAKVQVKISNEKLQSSFDNLVDSENLDPIKLKEMIDQYNFSGKVPLPDQVIGLLPSAPSLMKRMQIAEDLTDKVLTLADQFKLEENKKQFDEIGSVKPEPAPEPAKEEPVPAAIPEEKPATPAAATEKPAAQAEPEGEYEEDLFGNKIYKVGESRFALVKKEDGKTTLTKVPKKAEPAQKKAEAPAADADLFSQLQEKILKKPQESQSQPETVESTIKNEKAAPAPEMEEIDTPEADTTEAPAGEETDKIRFGAEGLQGGKEARKRQREQLNKQVDEILKKKDEEITDEDKKILARYSGRGGTDEISLNEYYTRSDQAEFVWDCAVQLGFRGGSVLEPSSATGVFIHTAPDNAIVTGVELDEKSSRIARLLHGDKHEIINSSFEKFNAKNPGEKYDLVIGNCPFGIRGATIMDDPDGRHHNTADQYFVERSIHKLKDNGIFAMIVPTGIMDNSSNNGLRIELNKQAEFLGAFRMPTGAFHHANAEVPTDIVFFRKRPAEVSNFLVTADSETISKLHNLGIMDHEFTSGRFFTKNPEFTMGTKTTGQYGRDTWIGKFDIEELKAKAGLLKPHKDNYEALKEYGIDIEKQTGTEAPKVGEVRNINGRQYRFNKNHRWERISDGFTGEMILTEREQEVAKELNLTPGEFMKLRRNIDIDGMHLTDEQRAVVAHNPEYNPGVRELAGLVNIPISKLDKCRDAALLGIAIQKYEELRQSPGANREEVWSTARKLEGKINDFIEKHGDPSDLVKYLNKGERKGIQTLYGAVEEGGKISSTITDPFNENQTGTKKSQIPKEYNDLKTVDGTIKELHEQGGVTDFEEFSRYYQGDEEITKDNFDLKMLTNDSIGITEEGKYAPVNEVYYGEVSSKFDAWKNRLSEIEEELRFSIDPAVTERLSAEKDKLENQTRTLREKAGYKSISDLPIRMIDAKNDMFDIAILNDYLKSQDFNFELVIDPSGKLNFADAVYAQIYELYHDKGALDKDEQSQLKRLLEYYFSKRTNPFELTFLNNLNGIPVTRYEPDAEEKIREIENGFNAYLGNREESPEIEEKYNRLYNNWIMRDYSEDIIEGIEKLDYDKKLNRYAPDGHQLTIRESISPNQWASIRRLVDQGKGMLAHGVGVGKTLQAIVAIAMMKQEGKCKKPLVVTPKSVLLNWNEEANLWLKDANVLVVGYKKDRNGKYSIQESNAEVRSKLIEIQRNGHNYDLILMTRDDFVGIGFSDETRNSTIEKLVAKYYPDEDNLTKSQKKKMEKMKQSIGKGMSSLNTRFSGINFEDLGVDMLIRDESHDCKNLFASENEANVKGLSGSSSNMPLHNYVAASLVRASNDNRNVVMLTATPVSNTPLEIYNMLIPFAEEEMDKMGIRSIDDFVNRYADIKDLPTMDADSSVSTMRKFAGFKSIDILRKMFFRFADYKTHKDVKGQNIRFPKENTIHEYTELNEGQKQILDHCRLRLWANRYLSRKSMLEVFRGELQWGGNIELVLKSNIGRGTNTPGAEKIDPVSQALADGAITKEDEKAIKKYATDYMHYWLEKNQGKEEKDLDFDGFFKIQSDMVKATGDLQWYKESATDYAMPVDDEFVEKHQNMAKLNRLTELVSEEYKNGGKQVIFAINLKMHDKIRESLIAAGVKPEEIKVVNATEAGKASDRLQITKDFNAGKYKVVIGNYATMGEGLNFNNGTTKGYHMQPPWNALAYEQGNGRFIRQGNPNETVDVHYMLSRGSVDAFMTQKVLDKKDMVEKFLKGETNNWEDDIALSADDILIELARDPEEAKRLMEIKRKNQQKATEEHERKKKLRKLTRYHANIRDMNKMKDKTSTVYERLKRENESIENEFNSTGHEYSKFLESNKNYFIDEKTGTIIPEGSLFGQENGDKFYNSKIDHENKIIVMVNTEGKAINIPFADIPKYVTKKGAGVFHDTGRIVTEIITGSSYNLRSIPKLMDRITEPGVFTPEQLDKIRQDATQKLKADPYNSGADFYIIDTHKNELVKPNSYLLRGHLVGQENRYQIVFPADAKFDEAVMKTPMEVISEYKQRPAMRNYYQKMIERKFPTTHTPPKSLKEVESYFMKARGLSEKEFKRAKDSERDTTPSEEARNLFDKIRGDDYQDYAELTSEYLYGKANNANTKEELISLITDPEFISDLNYARQYGYNSNVNWYLERIVGKFQQELGNRLSV